MHKLDDKFYDIDDGLDQYEGMDLDILKHDDPFMPRVEKSHTYGYERMHYVFVYGTMKEGFVNHGRIMSRPCNKLIGNAYSNGYHFDMHARYSSRNVLAPIVVRSEAKCRIYGELYRVNGWTLNEIDYAEGYPSIYNREEILVIYNKGSAGHGTTRAWIYVYEGGAEDIIVGHKSVYPFNDEGLGMIPRNRSFHGDDSE